MEEAITAVFDLCHSIGRVLVLLPVTVQLHLSDRFYRLFERVAVALESIDRTLKAPPEDFGSEDKIVRDATQSVHDAQERIPHRTLTTN